MVQPSESGPERDFRWRGHDVSRLEAVSDAVFAIALALVMLSGGVPTRISELRAAFEQIVPFVASFAVIAMFWHAHYLFFRRYGLRDGWSAFLNAVLLFLVLLFAYPLKLLFALVSQALLGIGAAFPLRELVDDDFPIMPVYSLGFGAIYVVLALMYRHAWKLRDELELDALERGVTRQYIESSMIMIAFALVSTTLALVLPGRLVQFAGWIFFGIGPAMGVHAWRWGVRRERMRIAAGS